MENLFIFFAAALTAAVTENAAFTRALGLNKSTLLLNSPLEGILYGGAMTWMVTATSLPVSLVNYYLTDTNLIRAIRAPLFMACTMLVYLATYFVTKKFSSGLFEVLAPRLPITTFNTALFGAFYISATQQLTAFQTTGYALGTGVGYTVALVIIFYARKRLSISPIPRSFRGLPIMLVYIGLLSLAIYGLIGHGLAI